MPVSDDGDLVRAYGFVAIYFAYLEDCVNDRLSQVEPLLCNVVDAPLDKVLRWRFSDRVEVLRKVFSWAEANGPSFDHKDEQLLDAEHTLSGCLEAAKERNDTLHSPIIADLTSGDVTRHSREGEQPVTSAGVYELANRIFALRGCVERLRFTLNSMLGIPRLV